MTSGRFLVRRRLLAAALALGLPLASPLASDANAADARPRSAEAIVWSDLDASDAWARAAIDHVAAANAWMRDIAPNPDGSYPFRPDAIETRKYLARAAVAAFAPTELPDPTIAFTDLDPGATFFPFASIAVKLRWMRRTSTGGFGPDRPVTTAMVHRVLVLALGLGPAAAALDRLHTQDGATFQVPRSFGALLLGMRLGLRHDNEHDESMDVGPTTKLSRAQVAYSLYRATTQPSYAVPNLLEQYRDIVLPTLSADQHAIVQWGVKYVGFPYVWSGEWGFGSREPGNLGGQPVPGFDCSGFVWWLMKADGGGWEISPPRPYQGWALDQRSSADMSRSGNLEFGRLRPGDLMFYDGDDDGRVDHVDVFIGNGWALDSSGGAGGVTIMWVGDGWYRDHFTHGRRVIGS
jgi:cell wall-associated NlpC family hydrolase